MIQSKNSFHQAFILASCLFALAVPAASQAQISADCGETVDACFASKSGCSHTETKEWNEALGITIVTTIFSFDGIKIKETYTPGHSSGGKYVKAESKCYITTVVVQPECDEYNFHNPLCRLVKPDCASNPDALGCQSSLDPSADAIEPLRDLREIKLLKPSVLPRVPGLSPRLALPR